MVPAAQIRGHRTQYGPDSGGGWAPTLATAQPIILTSTLTSQHGGDLALCEDDDLLQVEAGRLHLSAGLELLQLVYNSQTSQK